MTFAPGRGKKKTWQNSVHFYGIGLCNGLLLLTIQHQAIS